MPAQYCCCDNDKATRIVAFCNIAFAILFGLFTLLFFLTQVYAFLSVLLVLTIVQAAKGALLYSGAVQLSAGKMLLWLIITAAETKLMLIGSLFAFAYFIVFPAFSHHMGEFGIGVIGFLLIETLVALQIYAFLLVMSQRRQIIRANRMPPTAIAAASAAESNSPPSYAHLQSMERSMRAQNAQGDASRNEKPPIV